jgi:hypothetical protein
VADRVLRRWEVDIRAAAVRHSRAGQGDCFRHATYSDTAMTWRLESSANVRPTIAIAPKPRHPKRSARYNGDSHPRLATPRFSPEGLIICAGSSGLAPPARHQIAKGQLRHRRAAAEACEKADRPICEAFNNLAAELRDHRDQEEFGQDKPTGRGFAS